MTTIIILNAASSLVAAAYIGVLIARQRRRAGKAAVVPVYVPPSRLGATRACKRRLVNARRSAPPVRAHL